MRRATKEQTQVVLDALPQCQVSGHLIRLQRKEVVISRQSASIRFGSCLYRIMMRRGWPIAYVNHPAHWGAQASS